MPYYAQINSQNICNAVSELAEIHNEPHLIPMDSFDESVMGKEWNGSAWIDVPPLQPEPTWRISVGAFFDRFLDEKIPILSSADAVIQAMVKDAQVRKYIDLKRQDLPTMLDVIISKGFPVDKNSILNTPAADNELP